MMAGMFFQSLYIDKFTYGIHIFRIKALQNVFYNNLINRF